MQLERLACNPLLKTGSDASLGGNINGPSLIRVPPWVAQPLGRYYLYFAHHQGRFIRLAYADQLEGPWKIHAPGVLPLEHSGCRDHIASPDVHVDTARREIRMYFHGVAFDAGQPTDGHEQRFGEAARWVGNQRTRVAVSQDGLTFRARPENLGASYFRAFAWHGATYALAMPGMLYRSCDGMADFEPGPILFPPSFRHAAVHLQDHTLHVLFSRVGDGPEGLLYARIDLRPHWHDWRPGEPRVVLRPERDWEGGLLPATPSARGPVYGPVCQLRDPAFFCEDEQLYVLYAIAGEQGIGMARCVERLSP